MLARLLCILLPRLFCKTVLASTGHCIHRFYTGSCYLMDLWALSMAQHDDLGPFESYQHLYDAIDAMKLGDAPWQHFSAAYSGQTDADSPSWQRGEYDVWFRDPDVVIANMLDNPDFHNQTDYCAYVEVDKDNNRRWSDFMSANFAWRRSVGYTTSSCRTFTNEISRPKYTMPTQVRKVLCTARSSSGATKRRYPLRQATWNIIRYTCPSDWFTTQCDAPIVMQSSRLASWPFLKV